MKKEFKSNREAMRRYERKLIDSKDGKYKELVRKESKWLRKVEKKNRRRCENEGRFPDKVLPFIEGDER